jgi:hypothetical protein
VDERNIQQLKELLELGFSIGAALSRLGIDLEHEDVTVTPPHSFMGEVNDEESTNKNTKAGR